MIKKVLKAIEYFSLLNGVSDVTVALSGGADSAALLCVLLSLKEQLGINVYAAHFNHKIRGDEAERDEQFVRELCKSKNVELFCGSEDVPAYAKSTGKSLELAARELRYEFLSKVSIGVTATAHTASDNIETALFNLSRGTGLKGICGIPPKRDRYIRPLIFCTRQDIEDYCSQNNIPFVTDSTNLSDEYSRNMIRHKVIAELKCINPSVENTFCTTALSLSEDEDFIGSAVSEAYGKSLNENGLSVACLKSLHPAVRKRVLKLFAKEKTTCDIDAFHINGLDELVSHKGKLSMAGDITAVNNGKYIYFSGNNGVKKVSFRVTLEKADKNIFKNVNSLFLKNCIDCDKISDKPIIRTRMSGDSIRIKNRNCTKTLKKLYTEYGIDEDLRDVWPVISDSKGVVWVYGIGVAERVAADENSNNLIKINTEKIISGE